MLLWLQKIEFLCFPPGRVDAIFKNLGRRIKENIMSTIYHAYANGKEITDFYIGGKSVNQVWGGTRYCGRGTKEKSLNSLGLGILR